MARILIGVSGGIAAYKAVELARQATLAGHGVRVTMTEAARRFVGPATFEGITGAPVLTGEFSRDPLRGTIPGDEPPAHDPISTSPSSRAPTPSWSPRPPPTRSPSSPPGSATPS